MIDRPEKRFTVSLIISCKEMTCPAYLADCDMCLESVVAGCVRKFEDFRVSQITTRNNSRQFGVSFTAICRKPDCNAGLARGIACCTAHPDKCEMCLRMIVSQDVRVIRNFHVKEIAVV
ncbi:MAG: hypothetical protein C4521_13585 [Actinobacteria bacterium]|nr:MAG: hypothetical protein C4521_13585 [Actinomycetota bacterium]